MEPQDRASPERRPSTIYRRSEIIKESYSGAQYALEQEYPDRFAHFAQSLREVIDQLALHSSDPGHENLQGMENRSYLLRKTFSKDGEKWSMAHLCDMLARTYGHLSRVSHHSEKISRAQARNTLSKVEQALDLLTSLPPAMDPELDEMLKGPPSRNSAAKIADLTAQQAFRPYMIDKMHERWLPRLKNVGFFENPPPPEDSQSWDYERWAPAIYLEKCAEMHYKDVAGIIMSCPFPELPSPAVYTDFLRCAAVWCARAKRKGVQAHRAGLSADGWDDLDGAERVGVKALEEGWDRFMLHDSFRASYVEIAEELALGRKYDVATRMLRLALKPGPPGPPPADGRFDPSYTFVSDRFMRKMPEMYKESPPSMRELLDAILHESPTADSRGKKTGRGSFYDGEKIGASEAKSVLFSCVRECIDKSGSGGDGK